MPVAPRHTTSRPSASSPFVLRHLALTLAVVALLAALASLTARAQETWTTVSSPTSQNLWGLAVRPASASTATTPLFVAVGDGGTILTSPDALTWTPRTARTTHWLTAVTYSPATGRFVAVGDAGTLLTSDDGFTWTPRATGTTERLNAVAFGNDRWLAVGEHGALVTSADAVTWQPVASPVYSVKPTGWLRGLTFAYGTFVLTGENGAIFTTADTLLYFDRSLSTTAALEGLAYARRRFVTTGSAGLVLSSPDSATWRTGSPTTTDSLHALAFFNNLFVAAGDHGTVLTSPDGNTWSARATGSTALLTALASDSTTLVAVGFGGAILRSTAAQSAPAIVTPPADITEAAGNHVLLSVVATGTAPLNYQWSFNGRPLSGATADTLAIPSVAASNSGPYAVTVTNSLGSVTSPAATLSVIPKFPAPTDCVDPTFSPALPFRNAPSALLALPDGKILTAVANTATRLNSDGSVDPAFVSSPVPGVSTIAVLALQPDGKILVGGTNATNTGTLTRLTATGATDSTFAPAPSALGAAITSIVLQPDGKILLANNTSRLARLNLDGTADATFVSADLSSFPDPQGLAPAIKLAALAPDGRIIVAASPLLPSVGFFSNATNLLVARLTSTGALDPTLTPHRTRALQPQLLSVLPDHRILLASFDNAQSYGAGTWNLQRLNPDGTPDLTFVTRTGFIAKYSGNMRATIDARGRIVVAVAFQNALPGLKIMRFEPDGTLDPTLRFDDSSYGAFDNLLNALAPLSDGRVLLSRGSGKFVRLVAANAPRLNPPVALLADDSATVTLVGGSDVTVSTRVAGTGNFTHDWNINVSDGERPYPSYAPTSDSLTVKNLRTDATITTTITNPAGTLFYPPQSIRVPPSPPRFVTAPANLTVESGRIVTIPFDATGSGPLTYRWLFHGREIQSGRSIPTASLNEPYSTLQATGALQLFAFDPATAAGEYQLVLTNPLGSVTANVTLSLDPTSRLINVATRGYAGSGDNSLFAGFVISGSMPKWVLLRAVGPGLAPFGVTDYLADPKLTLFDAAGTKLAENDNWIGSQESYTTLNWPAMFAVPNDSRDAILALQLPPGSYTAQVSGVNGATGTALVEIYDQIHDTPRLINLSSRVLVRPGAQVAISGLVISGSLPKKILLRAVGPALAAFGVAAPLANPTLTLTDSTGAVIATNDDWETNAPSNLAALRTATASVGAFALSPNSRDAALLVTVPPGSYTALVTGVNNTTGITLVEIYEVP